MKQLFFGLTVACSLFFTSGCEKEITQQPTTAASSSLMQHKPTSSTRVSNVTMTAAVSGSCVITTPCGLNGVPSSKNNVIAITNTNQATFPSLTYTYYMSAGGSPTETFVPMSGAQYTCNAATSYFANSSLTNGARVLVFANDATVAGPSLSTNLLYTGGFITNYPVLAGPSNYLITTLGSFQGQSCTK